MENNKGMLPLLKWAGGKRQLLRQIRKYIPENIETYIEPFLGGGAVFFDLKPKKAIVNDLNQELVNLYNVIKENPEELINDLKRHKNESEYFYYIRSLDRDEVKFSSLTNAERASRIIFLNKTCYNGLFRVNNQGQFNTPFGRYKNPLIIDEKLINNMSRYFNQNTIMILNKDFEDVLKLAKKGDFVYLDPPYDPVSDSSSFTGYSKSGFGIDDQKRLKEACDILNKKDVKFLLSNSDTKFIRDLYKEYTIEEVMASRVINSKVDSRGKINEVLVRNYE